MKALSITRVLLILGKNKPVIRACMLISLVAYPSWLLAHSSELHSENEAQPVAKLQVGAMFSASAYSAAATDANGLWRIPGLLMGGDALPVEQGAQLDDASLWARYQWLPNSAVHASIGSHAGHSELALESLYLDYQPERFPAVEVSLGLMDAGFSPNASSHPSGRNFAETSLLAVAFWGGSIHDLALATTWQAHLRLKLGLELRDGDFFPASKGEGAQVLFAQTEQEWKQLQLKAGAWGMQAQAVQRADERYQAGHTHGTSSFTPPDVRFTGDSQLAGAWLGASLPLTELLAASLDYEAVRAKSDGQLTEANYTATYQAEHLGYAITPGLKWGDISLSYRFEKLSVDNRLSGAGAAVLATEANLINPEHPQRQVLQLDWQANKSLRWRVAYTKDKTLPQAADRFSVGLVWQQVFYQQ